MAKEELIASIAKLVGVPNPGIGVGSSVYKDLLVGVCTRLGLDANGTMPELAQRIVTAADLPYRADLFDSRLTPSGGGSTVTLKGLRAIRDAVQKLLN
ncbi:hypothetical protein [Nocardioides sp. SYSU DS0651]|uniref:hypothetical protein n=1 Tax=Nocardioides sp. SYSU DS0651 TaxID=3415955 RepID=UPI003F4C80B7